MVSCGSQCFHFTMWVLGSNLGYGTWQQVPLFTEPFHQPPEYTFCYKTIFQAFRKFERIVQSVWAWWSIFSAWEAEPGRPRTHGQFGLHSKFQAVRGYTVRLHLKTLTATTNKQKEERKVYMHLGPEAHDEHCLVFLLYLISVLAPISLSMHLPTHHQPHPSSIHLPIRSSSMQWMWRLSLVIFIFFLSSPR